MILRLFLLTGIILFLLISVMNYNQFKSLYTGDLKGTLAINILADWAIIVLLVIKLLIV